MQVELGDVVQIDGGLVIVTAVKDDRASVAPVSDFNGKNPYALKHGINRIVTNDRLFERRGCAGLAEFLKEQGDAARLCKKGMITLEPGDCICHGGEWRTVILVGKHDCTLGNLNGDEFTEKRTVNEFYTKECGSHKRVRFDATQRDAHLAEFLRQRKSPLLETETSDTTEYTKTGTEMKKPTKKTTTPLSRVTTPKPTSGAKGSTSERKGKLGQLFGVSVSRAVRGAGAGGVTYDAMAKYLKNEKIEMSETAIKASLAWGRAGKGNPAELTKVQLNAIQE